MMNGFPKQHIEELTSFSFFFFKGKDSAFVYSGAIDNKIYCHDLRNTKQAVFTLTGHKDSVTGLALDQKTRYDQCITLLLR